jgi:hypothetical protein
MYTQYVPVSLEQHYSLARRCNYVRLCLAQIHVNKSTIELLFFMNPYLRKKIHSYPLGPSSRRLLAMRISYVYSICIPDMLP